MARPTNTSIFLRKVREAGGRIANGALLRELGWSEEKYWAVHQELNESGIIARGRGQGGTVILVVPEAQDAVRETVSTLPTRDIAPVEYELRQANKEENIKIEIRELHLYKPAVGQLKNHWQHRQHLQHSLFEITAQQGRRDTGGSWSRPDIVGAGLRKFEYLPDRLLEIYSFELKAENDISVKGVLEALAHREFATRSYVVYHTGGRNWDDFAEVQRIEEIAARHGVGVFVATDIADFINCWEERVTATRSSPDPEVLDRFIKTTLSEDSKSQIRKWF